MSDYWDDVMRADYAEYMAEQSGKASGKKTKSSKTDTRKTKKRKVRYARVPSGAETCAFCIMLASRDFIYASEQTASHAHAHCDCRIVPGFTGETKVEGYDPDALKDQYLEARKAVEAMFTKADWEYVPGALRTKMILQEMRRQSKNNSADGNIEHDAVVSAGLSSRVSAGLSKKWLAHFDNETMTIRAANGKVVELEGDQTGVDITSVHSDLLRDAYVIHTHTTSIGGTFSSEDIETTVHGWVKVHEVTETKSGTVFKLERTEAATKESAEDFYKDFFYIEQHEYSRLKIEYYEAVCKPYELPFGDDDYHKVDKMLKDVLDRWLSKNSKNYGYTYSKTDAIVG